jgi:hypothetical protein
VSLANSSLTKSQLVDAILEMNATASRDWLMAFDFPALRGYFLRLHHALAPRGSYWERGPAAELNSGAHRPAA